MGGVDDLHDESFEDRVRATLLRRAADVRPRRPDWQELADRPDTVVVPLRAAGTGPGGKPARPGWLRPALAAASVVAIVVGTALILERRSGTGGGQAAPTDGRAAAGEQEPVEGTRIPAAGNADFQPTAAQPIYPVISTSDEWSADAWTSASDAAGDDLRAYEDPTWVAHRYLEAAGFSFPGGDLEFRFEDAQDADGETDPAHLHEANLTWSFYDNVQDQVVTTGTVFLRKASVDTGTLGMVEPWSVVGAMTHDLRVVDLRRTADRVSFVVSHVGGAYPDVGDVRVEVNDRPLAEPVDEEGELFVAPVPDDRTATVRLSRVLDGDVLAVTETAAPAAVRSPDVLESPAGAGDAERAPTTGP